jgi:C-terminal processing protease CtpA/Prc
MAPVAFLVIIVGSLAAGQAAAPGSQAAKPLDAAQKLAVIDEIASLMKADYIFADTAMKMEEALRGRLKAGEFDAAGDSRAFAQAVSRVLLEVSKDKHIGFSFNPQAAADMRRLSGRSEEEARRVREQRLEQARRGNFGFQRVERLNGNVGYIDFRIFSSPDQAGETAIAAMNFLAYCEAIIVDLRRNGGGEPAQIQLISTYFFPEPVHLNDLYTRATDSTEHYWTLPYVPGPRPVNADLYILTSSRTFSGAEEFTYNMKNLKRATVIGETTGGGAHPTMTRIVQQDYLLRVPFARAINPVSKTNWEGTGVVPDIAVPADQAFDKAYVLALERLAAKTSDTQRKREYESILAGLKAPGSPAAAGEKR